MLDAERACHAVDNLVHQRSRLEPTEGQQAKLGDVGLLRGALLERLLVALAIAGVPPAPRPDAGRAGSAPWH